MTSTIALDKEYLAGAYGRFDVAFARGEGATLYDESGKRYIDMGAGIAVSALGYGDREWVEAVGRQAASLAHASNLYYTQPQTELAAILCQHSGMKKVFFGNSGAEANECAIKVARKYAADKYGEGKRPVIVTMQNSFHGRTLATLAATGQDAFHHTFGPFPEGFKHVPVNDAAALAAVMDKGDVCGVLLETIQGEGGVCELDAEYIAAVRALCDSHDALMMVDEVQTGNGRTGEWFSYQHFGVLPDVVSTAKGLAGGLPMGACLMGEKAKDVLTPGSHGSTFGGNPICAAGAVAVQKRLTKELLDEVSKKGEHIKRELTALPNVKSVTGRGLMLGVDSDKDARALVKALLERGVVTLTAKHKLRLLPPLVISWDELNEALAIIKEELTK